MKQLIIISLIASFVFMVTSLINLLMETVEDERSITKMHWLNIKAMLGANAVAIHLCYLINYYGLDWIPF